MSPSNRDVRSAGILLFRRTGATVELLIVHPGGPLWSQRDDGAWSLPKGEYEPGEEPLAAARRPRLPKLRTSRASRAVCSGLDVAE